ncbi:hypothetical protein LZ32DRAFT_610098 [Colletotrichum eremochloae]|nr:hypothetical protein LZ32DRAFT_610098 [Colletotrichum eremochloae]
MYRDIRTQQPAQRVYFSKRRYTGRCVTRVLVALTAFPPSASFFLHFGDQFDYPANHSIG